MMSLGHSQSTVQRRYLLGTERIDRQVREVQSIAVVCVRFADADDSEPLPVPRIPLVISSPLEPNFNLNVDGFPTQITDNIEDPLSFERKGPAAPFP